MHINVYYIDVHRTWDIPKGELVTKKFKKTYKINEDCIQSEPEIYYTCMGECDGKCEEGVLHKN